MIEVLPVLPIIAHYATLTSAVMKGFALHDDTHLLVFRRTATEANKQLINKANAIFIDWKI